ncbi:hypothetical protein HK100_008441 [Physocladia obscura]|uniref:Uncharacterized protein n=1 Tax=Physocladia obscura TaxID=109957 RepID=A0AAD5XMH8_9FUNG|nr:hypothetical protein HK100_008441 [Physocladia obscura]
MEEEGGSILALAPLNLTGVFSQDYVEACKRAGNLNEFPRVLRIGFPLPPLPLPSVSQTRQEDPNTGHKTTSIDDDSDAPNDTLIQTGDFTTTINNNNINNNSSLLLPPPQTTTRVLTASAENLEQPPPPLLGAAAVLGSSSSFLAAAQPLTSTLKLGSIEKRIELLGNSGGFGGSRNFADAACITPKYFSRYKFQPTICVETTAVASAAVAAADNEDDDEVQKVEVRGWRINTKILDILSTVITTCTTVTSLVAVLSSNIRLIALDENPDIPETLYGYLLSEDSLIKHLSLRMNRITDVGAKMIASTLKINRTMQSLNLFMNCIGKDGAADFADALKFNQTLTSLSLAKNNIGDEGISALAKMLSNFSLLHDELSARKKAVADLDRLRRELEDDPMIKKAKLRGGNSSLGRNQVGKKSEENLSKNNASTLDSKSVKKGGPVATGGGAGGASSGVGGGGGSSGATKAVAPGKAALPANNKKTPEAAAPPPAGKKGAPPPATPAPAQDKGGGGKDKKGVAVAAVGNAKGVSGKKGKIEEAKEEVDDSNEISSSNEPLFEHNGQYFLIGNRTLNNLNLRQNGITETGVRLLLDMISEQELSAENTPEGMSGIFRIALHVSKLTQINITKGKYV